MAHASTFTYRNSLKLLGVVLMLVCALSPHEVRAQKSVPLTVKVTVTDPSGRLIQSGTVTIKRVGGNDKVGKLVNGVANIDGNFVMEPDYQVRVTSEGYKQLEPLPTLPVELLKSAARADKTVTLPQAIVVHPQVAPNQSLEVDNLVKQFSALLPTNPELLDMALQHADAQPELQQRIIKQIRAGQHSWVTSVVTPTTTIWSYWWLLALPSMFAAGLVVGTIRHGQRGITAVTSRVRFAATASTNQEPGAAGVGLDLLRGKIERLVEQQETLVKLLGKVLDRQPPVPGDAPGAVVATGAVTQGWADATQRAGTSSETMTATNQARLLSDFNDYAHSHYKRLVREGHISPAPKYLEAEVRSSPKDLVGDKQVFLQEVEHTQGAFVLFADENGKGLVFPNPQLNFSSALRPVFPQLTASDFNISKETIVPVPVTRVGDDRWRVERKP